MSSWSICIEVECLRFFDFLRSFSERTRRFSMTTGLLRMSSVSPALRSPIGSASPCSEDVGKRIHYAKSGKVAGIAEIFV